MNLTYRQISESPPIYRVSTDGVEIGSVSLWSRRGGEEWHWGVDVMPLLARPTPNGNADSFDDALAAFKSAFTTWLTRVDPEKWRENLEHKRQGQERLRAFDRARGTRP